MRNRTGVLILLLLLPVMIFSACAGVAPRSRPAGGAPRWPYAGMTDLGGVALAAFQQRFFSGRCLEIDPNSHRLYAESGLPGGITVVSLPDAQVLRVLDFGPGVHVENLLFHPRDGTLFVLGSTVDPENLGHVDFARALLKVDLTLPMLQVSIPLKSDGYSRGLALHQHKSLLYSLDASSEEVSGGATLSMIDLLSDELVARRLVGALPARLGRRGLVLDERANRLYALLVEGGSRSDFDPAGRDTVPESAWLAVIDADSLGVIDRYELPGRLDYQGLVPTPRGVLIVGVTRHATSLVEFDTRFMRESGSIALPEPASDVVADDRSAIFPGTRGLYVVDLELMKLDGILPMPLIQPGELALAPNGRLSCVILRDPDQPGSPALGVVDLETGKLERLIQ